MIIAKNIQSLYSSHKDEIHKLVYESQKKPVTHAELSLVHDVIDKEGKRLYRWENPDNIPLFRYEKMLEYMQLITKGLTAKEDEMLDERIEQALQAGLKNEKVNSAVTIGAAIHERKVRRKMCVHSELMFNYIAVQIVREDESPLVFDNDIQMSKVVMLKEFAREGVADFFLTSPELKKLRDLLEMSKQDLETYIAESHIQTQRLKELFQIIESKNTSKA